jgi:hypothetical protein
MSDTFGFRKKKISYGNRAWRLDFLFYKKNVTKTESVICIHILKRYEKDVTET